MEWNLTENVITDAQYGFQPNRSTIDAIFALQSLISQKLNNKQRLYCCFIDYQKAFDTVNREKLWYILVKAGITGKLLRIIRSLYTDVRACIKSTGQISEEFPVNTGLLQGEVLSPLLFNMYINDLESHRKLSIRRIEGTEFICFDVCRRYRNIR